MCFLTAHHGRHESLTFRREGLQVPRNPTLQQPWQVHARVCNGNISAVSNDPQSHVHEPGTKRQIHVHLLLLFRSTSTSQATCFCVVSLTERQAKTRWEGEIKNGIGGGRGRGVIVPPGVASATSMLQRGAGRLRRCWGNLLGFMANQAWSALAMILPSQYRNELSA